MLIIEKLLKQFNITKEDIQSRKVLKDKLFISGTVLADNFCKKYLENSKELSNYYDDTDLNRFIKTIKRFIVFLFFAPVDEKYLYRIQKIGYICVNIKLDIAIVKYGFCCINQLLYKMSELDSVIKHNLDLISRFLSMAEYIIIDSIYRKTAYSDNISKNSLIRIIDFAGLKAVRKIYKLFLKRDILLNSKQDIEINILKGIKKIFEDVLPWAIKKIVIDTETLDSLEFDIVKIVSYKEYKIYFGIKLEDLSNRLYIEEILTLLFEAIELNFTIKEREQSLIDLAKKAETSNSDKDKFLACISHELRTPLTAINGFSQILMMRRDTPYKIKDYMEKINKEGNSLLNMVNTILDFAKLDAGKMHSNQKMSRIFFIIKEVEVLIMHMANQKNISLNTSIDENLYLSVDPELFKQVLINLISNSIKFTPEDGQITLTASYDEKYKEYLFSVCDTGIGISKEDQTKLFHSFVQIENIYQKSVSGSGLGLMICKKIIEDLHNGRIWVESEPGNGSCFYFTVPTV